MKRECAQAFHRLAALPHIRKTLLSCGAATAIISLAYQLKSPKRGLDCALALVSLTLVEHAEWPNVAEFLVQEGAVSAFMALMSLGADTVAPICVQGLFNLTTSAVGDGYYTNIEKVIKAIVNVPFTDKIDPRPVILKACVNCSRSYRLQPRLIEEGAIQIIEAFVPRIRNEEHREMSALILFNLSTSRQCRSDMVVKVSHEFVMLV